MPFIKKSVPELQEEIQYYANALIGISGALAKKAPLSVNARTIALKLENMASEASGQKIALLDKGEREIATLYAQEIDTLAQLAEIFYGSELENLGSGKAKKIDALCRILLASAADAEKLFKEEAARQQIRLQYSGAEARA